VQIRQNCRFSECDSPISVAVEQVVACIAESRGIVCSKCAAVDFVAGLARPQAMQMRRRSGT